MTKRGRPRILDGYKRREILAILSVGGTRQVAASYVGCALSTIENTAKRSPEFAERLRRSEQSFEVEYLDNIRRAAKESKYWRAAAWALERLRPDRYAHRSPDVITLDQIRRLMAQLAGLISEEVPERYRKNVLKRLGAVFADLGQSPRKRKSEHDA
jgi:hypothetical protein